MAKLTEKLRELLRLVKSDQPTAGAGGSGEQIVIGEQHIRELMHLLEKTRDVEYSCNETFALLDEFVELVASQQDAAALMPLVQHHIEMCDDCHDRYEVLLDIIRGQSPPASSAAA